MKAILLAGGYGTRLYPLTLRMPKVMVPVAGKPVLEHLLSIVKNAGITDVVLSLNSRQASIEQYFGDGSKWGVRLTYVFEESMSDEDKFGAIGAIQYALEKTGGPSECLVLNGDNLFYGLDISRMTDAHRRSGANATLALFTLTNRADVEQYGVMKIDDSGRVLRFQEKPKVSEAVSNLASVGVYHLGEAFVREYLPAYVEEQKRKEVKPDRVGDLWAHFVEKIPLYGHAFEGMWGDTNTPETYITMHKQAMHFYVGDGNSHHVPHVTESHKVKISPSAHVSPEATIKGPCIIEDGCVVEAGAIVGPAVHLMKNVAVGHGACVHGSIVFRGAVIGPHAHVTDAILDIGSEIGERATVEEYALVGYKARVLTGARLTSHSRVWPLLEVGKDTMLGGDVLISEERIREELKEAPLF